MITIEFHKLARQNYRKGFTMCFWQLIKIKQSIFLQLFQIYFSDIRKRFIQKYLRKVMGNHQIAKEKEQRASSIYETPQESIKADDLCTLADGAECEEGINIEFIKKSSFKHSSNVLASKNIMSVNRQSSQICSSQTKCTSLSAPIQGLSQELVQVLTGKFKKPVKSSPSFPPVKIDFKNFVVSKPASIQHQYKILQKIGAGGFGVVYKAQSRVQAGQFRAIKKIDKKKLKQSDAIQLNNEFQILKKCDHPNIIKIYDSYEDQSYFFVVSELCQGGNLLDYYNKNHIQQDQVKIIIVEMLSTLKYLHNLRIQHRDIKLQNILIIRNKAKQTKIQIKLIDFGLSLILTHPTMRIDEMSGTLLYMAPESICGELTLKSDIWSCGIILYMLVTRHMPFKFTDSEDLIGKIEYCRIIRKHLNKINMHAKILITLMLEKDANKRITADRALKCEWLKNTKANQITNSAKRRAATQILAYEPKNNLISMIESFIAFKKVNQLERQRLAALFAQFDKDKSGFIDIREFKAIYLQNTEQYDEGQIEELLKVIDKNQSGCIDFTQFIIAMHHQRETFHFKYLTEIFQFFDINHSGDIQKSQIKMALKGIKNEELDQLFAELDVNSNQKISENQFVKYFKTNQF